MKNDADSQAVKVDGTDKDDEKSNGSVGVVHGFEDHLENDTKQTPKM